MTDLQLFENIRSDGVRSFESLFDIYYSRLCSFACQFVNGPQVAEEIVSHVFTTIWLRRKEINIEKNVKSYLYRSVRNHAINYLKSEKIKFTDINDDLIMAREDSGQPDSAMIYQELEDEVETMINRMPKKRQVVFRLSRIEGLKYSEIAEELDISVNTVQNHMVEANKYMSKHSDRLSVFRDRTP